MTTPMANADILRAMLDNGRKDEALKWLEGVARHLPAEQLVPLQQMALNATTTRKRGGAGHVRDEFADMCRELAFANAVQATIDSGNETVSIEKAVGDVARDGVVDPSSPNKRIRKSESAVRDYYRKWKNIVKLNESPFV
ncbi:hypothetical protein [Cognatiluteimonas weifangensis]|uniref:hypothetical protein n=1 Tax=Cognatiluteimonas weifangensis TaxID=2303539 RepID=UPI0011C1AE66|nr:hypothetical protein [Luteimonas weifangensis]